MISWITRVSITTFPHMFPIFSIVITCFWPHLHGKRLGPSAFVGNGAESHPRRTWSKWTSAMVQKCWELSWLFQWKIPYNWRWSIEIYWYGYAKKVLSKTQQWHDYTYSWLNQRCFICICMYTYIYTHTMFNVLYHWFIHTQVDASDNDMDIWCSWGVNHLFMGCWSGSKMCLTIR